MVFSITKYSPLPFVGVNFAAVDKPAADILIATNGFN